MSYDTFKICPRNFIDETGPRCPLIYHINEWLGLLISDGQMIGSLYLCCVYLWPELYKNCKIAEPGIQTWF